MSTKLRRNHKYPEEYCCCNDTAIGCGLLCCTKCDKFMEEDVLDTETDAENAFIWEKTIDKLVKTINSNWSWASAGLLASACQATIIFNSASLLGNWLYFITVFIAGVLVAVIEHSFESPQRIAQELEVTVPKKKAALGIKDEDEVIQKQETIHLENARQTAMLRILNFVKIEGNELWENMENLFIAILSNVIALACNSAVTATFIAILEGTQAAGSQLITAQYAYVLALAWIVCHVSLYLGKRTDELDIAMHDKLKQNGLENSKKDLLKHSTKKRVFKLIEYTSSFVLAWAFRDAIKMTILAMYGGSGTDETLAAVWLYCVIVTLVINYSNTLNVRYYLLYPRVDHIALQFETAERKVIGNVLWKNAQTVVGLAWYDALVETPESLSDKALEKHRIWLLWLEAIGAMIISGVVGGLWANAKLRFEKKQKGVVNALFSAFDEWHDPKHVMEQEENEKKKKDHDDNDKDKVKRNWRESFLLEYLKEFIDLMVFALGFASGFLISAAVKAMLVKSYEGVYDPEEVTDISADVVWSVWLAFFIALVISTLSMTFLTKGTQAIRKKKHEIFKKWDEELKQKDKRMDQELEVLEKKEEEENELLNDGKTHNVTDDVEESGGDAN